MRRAFARIATVEGALALVGFAALVAIGVVRGAGSVDSRNVASYSSYDYAGGGYRAFAELLARRAIRVERFERPAAYLDASVDTLVWADPLPFDPRGVVPSRADLRALEAWVRAGGSLLYIGDDAAAAKQGVLHLPRPYASTTRVRGRAYVAPSLASRGIARVDGGNAARWERRRDVRVLLDDGRGPYVATYAYGRGRVTVASDRELFSNAALATGDRARLAVALASPARLGGTVAFDETVHGHSIPLHWWNVVPRPFAWALAFAAVVLSIAFAGAALRLGPPIVPFARDDRDGSDFLNALASLLRRGKTEPETLASAHASTARVLARRLGLAAGADDATIAARLGRAEDREAFATLATSARGRSPSSGEFVRGVAIARRLRKDPP